MARNPQADMTVQVVTDPAQADQRIILVGDQILVATPADVGKVVAVAADGTLVLAAGGAGGLSEAEVQALIDTSVASLQTAAQVEALIDTNLAELLVGAPAALDTLNELAAAINDDASFAATVTTALAGKAAIPPAWTAYTPDWIGSVVNPVTVNGSRVGAFVAVGKVLFFRILVTIGSLDTLGSGTWRFGLPAGFTAVGEQSVVGMAVDTSASARAVLVGKVADGGTQVVQALPDGTDTFMTNAAPYAWASGDTIALSGAIQVA